MADRMLTLLLAQPANVQARYESKIHEARQGTLTDALAMQVMRQVGGFSSPAEGEAQRTFPRGDGSGHGTAKPQYSDTATEAQVRFLNSLRVERGSEPLTADQIAKLTKRQASADIEAWKAIPRPKREYAPKTQAAPVELEDGIYRVDDTWYKVVHAVHGSGRQYAKRLVVDGPGSGHFEYDGGAVRKITPDHKATLEEAKQFGQLYGICCNCAAVLTDEASIAAGIGPICAKKF